MAQLSFDIRPSFDTADHEARPIVDGIDLLGRESLGLDPPDLIAQLCPPKQGLARIGRCACGVIGCGDEAVDIIFATSEITWQGVDKSLSFERTAYLAALYILQHDHSWEDTGRRIERLLTEAVRKDTRWKTPGCRFDWVSTRVAHKRLVYSFTQDGTQNLLRTKWDARSEASAFDAHKALFAKSFEGK